MMTENVVKTVVMAVAIVAASVVLAGKVGTYAEQVKESARYQAVDSCMAAGMVTTVRSENGREATTTEPIREVYAQCMADKGLEVTQGASVSTQPNAESDSEGESVAK